MLKTVAIDKSFGERPVLNQISLELQEGHIFGLLGTNGAGKSTLLRLISGILQADRGNILLNDQSVYENPAAKDQI